MERIELLKSFLEEDPNDNFSLYALSLEYVKLNNVNDAIATLEQLQKLNPDYLAAYYQLGKLFELQKNFDKASLVFNRGLEIARKQKDLKTYNELQSALDMLEE